MTKIISITRDVKGLILPSEFTVGQVPGALPLAAGQVPEGPAVEKIKFYETGALSNSYRGPCFVVTFENATVRRIVPAEDVADIAVETAKDKPAEENIPALSEED